MEIKTAVTEVKIYRSGASAVRRGTVHLEAGENSVKIAGLTAGAYTDTMQLRFPAGVKASAVHVVSREDEEKEAEALMEKADEIKAEIEALDQQAEMWRKAGEMRASDKLSVGEIESFITRYPERIHAIQAEIRAREKEQKKIEKELNEAADRDSRPLISAVLSTNREGDYPFELVYQESAAFWNPLYEIHTDGKASPLEIRFKAQVNQNTGEDWNGVKISLRTGRTVFGARLPELIPVYLDFEKPQPSYGSVQKPRLMAAKTAVMDAVYEEESMPMAFEETAELLRLDMGEADVSGSAAMTEYRLSGLHDVKSGSDGLAADLQSFSLKADYVIKAVPKINVNAYLLAEVKTADLPMSLGGNASVYLDGVYTGTARLNPDFGKETWAVALGTEERISISRIETKKNSSESLILGDRTALYEYDIKVTSALEEPVKISIIDQIPKSQNEKIKVDIISLDKGSRDEKTGEVKWDLELKPGEIRNIHAEYRVKWPKDRNIQSV